jgi:hypothetical protein
VRRELVDCPPNLEPWRFCLDSGKPMPMFMPAELVPEARMRWRRMWIEPMPPITLSGYAITHAEWTRVLEDSSKSART